MTGKRVRGKKRENCEMFNKCYVFFSKERESCGRKKELWLCEYDPFKQANSKTNLILRELGKI